MTNEKEKMELETAALLRALLRCRKWIALGAVLGAGLVLLVTVLFVGPVYQSDVTLRVTNRVQADGIITPEDVSASRDLVESCAVIVHTRAFLKEVAAAAGMDSTARELGRMVAAEAVNGTEFLRVTVTSGSPEEAARIAEAIGGLLPGKAAQILAGAGAELVDIIVTISPVDEDFKQGGLQFVDEVKGGNIPKEFIPSVQKGFVTAMKNGVLAGYPMDSMKVVLKDGSFHPVDSDQLSFEICAIQAYKNACAKAGPALTEPIMKLEVVTPEENMGDQFL